MKVPLNMSNVISKDGEYAIRIYVNRDKHQTPAFNGYTYKGLVMRMDNPKRGQVVQLPRGDFMKIADIGTQNLDRVNANSGAQEHVVFLRRYKG